LNNKASVIQKKAFFVGDGKV